MKAIPKMLLLMLLLAFAPACWANDGFEGVTCSGDVGKAMIGKKLSNEPDVKVEARHKNLALKDLGGDEISDDVFLSTWSICGSEYLLTLKRGVVADVLKLPAHSGAEKEFDGDCKKGGKPVPGVFVGILVDKPGSDYLVAKSAWKLDDKTGKFTPIPVGELTCARHGIIFPDGEKK
jgi:hypothetical protein